MSTKAAHQPRGDIRDLLVETAHLSIEQMPLLKVILDRSGQIVADRLRMLSSALPLVSLHDLSIGRTGDLLDSYEMRAIVGVFHVVGWDTQVLVGFDRDFVFSAVEMLLGGDGSEPPMENLRNLSGIEAGLCQFLFEQVGSALQSSLILVDSTRFRLDRTETRMDFASAGRRSQSSVIARFVLQALNRGGEMFVIIPQSALAPQRQALSRFPAKETDTPVDPAWVRNLSENARRTEVSIRAVTESEELTLGDITRFKVGQVIKLDASMESRVRVESSDQPLFWAYLGQNEGRHTLCIDEPVNQERELVSDVLAT